MAQTDPLLFGPFRLDPRHKKLWREEQEIPLRARSFAVLHYLAAHPGQLVAKEDLKKTLWVGVRVTNTVLRVCIREIRNALGDSAATPQFIETVARLGYRFIACGADGGFVQTGARKMVQTLAQLAANKK